MLWKFHEVKAITFDQITTLIFDQITTKYGYAMKKFPAFRLHRARSTYLNVMWRLQIYEVWTGVRYFSNSFAENYVG